MAWIFRYDQSSRDISDESSGEWLVEQHHSLMSPGDLVFFWRGAADGAIVGVGRIQTQPYRAKADLRNLVVRVSHNVVLTDPIPADACRNDPVLADLSILSRADQSNYGLSRTHADRLLGIAALRQDGLGEALNLRPETIPTVSGAESTEETRPAVQQAPSPKRPWDEVFTTELDARVEAFRSDAAAERVAILRSAAYERLRELLAPDRLAEIDVDRFLSAYGTVGGLILDGDQVELAAALARLGDVSADEIAGALSRGDIAPFGNLTWNVDADELAAERNADAAGAALRLRAGLSHLFAENRPIESRIDRMRRSMSALWPEAATGILMITEPADHIVYHRPSIEALARLGARRALKPSFDDYQRFREFVARFEERYGLGPHASVDLFLRRIAEPGWPFAEGASPTHGARRSESRAAAKSSGTSEGETSVRHDRTERHTSANATPRKTDVVSAPNRPTAAPTEGQALFALFRHLRHRGVVMAPTQAVNLYLSLKTVPVLVLDGPPGIGKNLIARSLAEGIGARYHHVPMTNETGTGPANAPLRLRDLLGQFDNASGVFRPEPLYHALLAAAAEPERAHFVCVDTIDGWQEDSWLSEYLRVQDSRRPEEDGRWMTEPIVVAPGSETVVGPAGDDLPALVPVPDNLFLILTTFGQVGIGDITAERCNVVDLGPADFDLDAIRPGHAPEGPGSEGLGGLLVEKRSYRTIDTILDRPWMETWNDEIAHIHSVLAERDLGIGYRLRDDILRFLAYADDLNGELPYGQSFPLDAAFDHQIAQRIVPRLVTKEPDDEAIAELLMYAQGSSDAPPRFPRATAHLEMLQRRLE